MKQLIASVARNIPRELKNYHIIKRQDIYIPYCEIGVTCLTKEVTEINLFFETVLKLVDAGIKDVYEISTIMGVEFKLLKETLVDMIEQMYLTTSENRILITQKGKKALTERKLVTIQKKNINEIFVNMISGELEENSRVTVTKASKKDLCLSEEYAITKDFLEDRYVAINEIYQNNQIENHFFNTRVLQRELYKILEVSYNRLHYMKEELIIYKNNDSDDYEFVISGDVGEQYLNCFYRQVREIVYSGMENFFERDWSFANSHRNMRLVNLEERLKKKKLIEDMYGKDTVSDELLDEFMQKRELVDNREIEMFFLNNEELEYDGLLISCDRLRRILNNNIITAINHILKKKVWILYQPEEFDIVNYLNKNFGDKRKKKEIFFLEKQEQEGQFICFYPNVLIEFVERTENVFDRPISILEGRIEFDTNDIKNKMGKIINERNISFEQQKKEVSDKKDHCKPIKGSEKKNVKRKR